ncbi:MAG: hypothetical protein WC511_02175 [Candidatus Pacearchaeota archaeon]
MKIWAIDEIRENILKSDYWVERAILVLYNQQTEEEKKERRCLIPDGKGFDNADISTMSSFVAYAKKYRGFTAHQIFEARKRLMKYLAQLTDIANTNEDKKEKKRLLACRPNPFRK